MPRYIANRSQDEYGLHEVHEKDCSHAPDTDNQYEVGIFPTCKEAINHLKRTFPSHLFDGCKHCSPACHTDRVGNSKWSRF